VYPDARLFVDSAWQDEGGRIGRPQLERLAVLVEEAKDIGYQ
jgi:hypothetical protein